MDAGWEIFVSQMNFHVHQFVQTLCQLNVMKTASLVTWDGQMDVGWETTVSQWRIPVQWHVREAFNKKIKSVDFFHTSQTP